MNKRIADKVWGAFVRGEFASAVFEAMKSVEVAVREVGGFSSSDIGVQLMRDAFGENGPLCDKLVMEDENERKNLAHIFAGAIGTYKNPGSHRYVNLEDPQEALELVLLANHLLRIVDTRAAAKKGAAHV